MKTLQNICDTPDKLRLSGFMEAGDTYETGDCEVWEAGIDHYTPHANQMVIDGHIVRVHKEPAMWYQRIIVYGSTKEQAEELRDKLVDLYNKDLEG